MSQNRELEMIKKALAELSDRVEIMTRDNTPNDDELTRFVSAARTRLTDISNQTKRAAEQAKEGISTTAEHANTYARENPWVVAGIAAGLGLIVGLISQHNKR
jgi:ElaB/YqjD/DUF883 family membrane-anchored ribosome-binding protein